MIRKWMTTLLAMLLAMMLPLCALADTQHTSPSFPATRLQRSRLLRICARCCPSP